MQLPHGMLGDPGQHVGEPGLWIDAVHLGGLCRGPNYAERSWAKQKPVQGVKRTLLHFHSA